MASISPMGERAALALIIDQYAQIVDLRIEVAKKQELLDKQAAEIITLRELLADAPKENP